jgi:bifunctional DNA-binding transcriptional regulator/antitoxin component of YhaV-PrlF toxin-antitoxin module
MNERWLATLNSDGGIALPAELIKVWNLKPGDQIAFADVESESSTIEPRRKRSIFDRFDEFKLPSLGRPLEQEDIDNAVAEAMAEQDERSRRG